MDSLPTTLILDASTLLNLYATGRLRDIAATGLFDFAVSDYVMSEEVLFVWERGPDDAESQRVPVELDALIEAGLLDVLRLDTSEEVGTFVNFAISIDDGEAITAALAVHRECALATDDRKARRVIANRSPAVHLVSTLDLLKAWAEEAQVPASELREVLGAMSSGASYVPGPGNPHYDWWQEVMQQKR